MKYDVILADPPWSFKVWDEDTGSGRSASAHYTTQSLEWICDLPVRGLTERNCALFLWVPWPRIFDAQTVMKAWGFRYATLGFEWWKLNKGWRVYLSNLVGALNHRWLEPLFHFGMGYYTRANSEPCLLGIKGSMPVKVHDERNFIISPIRAHSQKPDEQYGKIERLYPDMKYLEMFARQRRAGWDAFGNEVEGSIDLEGSVV